MQVPTLNQGTPEANISQVGVTGAKFNTNVDDAALGQGPARTQAYGAVQGAIGEVGEIAKEAKKQADQVAVLGADNKLSEWSTTALYHPQDGAMNQRGENAFAQPEKIQEAYKKQVDQITNDLTPDQRLMFGHMAYQKGAEINKQLQEHVSREKYHFDTETSQSAVVNARNAAVAAATDAGAAGAAAVRGTGSEQLGYVDIIADNVRKQAAVLTDWGKRNGMPAELIKEKIQEAESATHKEVIEQMLAQNHDQVADAYFKANKEHIIGKDAIVVQKGIEEGTMVSRGLEAWDKLKDMKLADGRTPDEAGMVKKIMDGPGAPKEKEKTAEFIKAKSKELVVNLNHDASARDNKFSNELTKAFNAKVPIEDAMKLATQYGVDEYDIEKNKESVRNKYAPPTANNPTVHYQLWEGIREGTVDQAKINQAEKNHDINGETGFKLRQDLYNSKVQEEKPEIKDALETVKNNAKKSFGSDTTGFYKYMNTIHEDSRGMSGDEILENGQKKLDYNEKSRTHILGTSWGGQKQYVIDRQQRDALGTGVVKAIGQSYQQQTGSTTYGSDHIESFARQLGGYNNIKLGTPGNKAIQMLIEAGQKVTPENVNAVLKRQGLTPLSRAD